MFNLKDSRILNVGGDSYLGEAVCRHLAEAGARPMIADLDEERARTLASKLTKNGADAKSCRLEAGDEQSTREAVEKTVSAYGKIKNTITVVNNEKSHDTASYPSQYRPTAAIIQRRMAA